MPERAHNRPVGPDAPARTGHVAEANVFEVAFRLPDAVVDDGVSRESCPAKVTAEAGGRDTLTDPEALLRQMLFPEKAGETVQSRVPDAAHAAQFGDGAIPNVARDATREWAPIGVENAKCAAGVPPAASVGSCPGDTGVGPFECQTAVVAQLPPEEGSAQGEEGLGPRNSLMHATENPTAVLGELAIRDDLPTHAGQHVEAWQADVPGQVAEAERSGMEAIHVLPDQTHAGPDAEDETMTTASKPRGVEQKTPNVAREEGAVLRNQPPYARQILPHDQHPGTAESKPRVFAEGKDASEQLGEIVPEPMLKDIWDHQSVPEQPEDHQSPKREQALSGRGTDDTGLETHGLQAFERTGVVEAGLLPSSMKTAGEPSSEIRPLPVSHADEGLEPPRRESPMSTIQTMRLSSGNPQEGAKSPAALGGDALIRTLDSKNPARDTTGAAIKAPPGDDEAGLAGAQGRAERTALVASAAAPEKAPRMPATGEPPDTGNSEVLPPRSRPFPAEVQSGHGFPPAVDPRLHSHSDPTSVRSPAQLVPSPDSMPGRQNPLQPSESAASGAHDAKFPPFENSAGEAFMGESRRTIVNRPVDAKVDPLANKADPLIAERNPVVLSASGEAPLSRIEMSAPFPATSPEATRPPHPVMPHAAPPTQQMVGQIIEMLEAGQNRAVELRLQPEELGRISISLSQDSTGGLTVGMNAERADTLDLARRNIELLGQELRRLGYGSVEFHFGGGGAGDHSGGNQADSRVPDRVQMTADAADHEVRQVTAYTAIEGIDLRL